MGQIRTQIKTAQPVNDFERILEKALQIYCYDLAGILNNGLKFSDNFDGQIIDVADTGAADVANVISHTLKRVPTGFLVIDTNKAVAAYRSASTTTTTITLKFNTANCTVKVFVF